MTAYIYILANQRNGTLYVGVTNNIVRRVYEHKNDLVEGFTKKYCVHLLVYYEVYSNMIEAITREKQIKKYSRSKKLELIERENEEWKDLYDEIL